MQELDIEWDCNAARSDFASYGLVHLQGVLPPLVLKSAQRACQKIVLDHGGGNWEARDEFPPVLCDWTKTAYNADINVDKLHTTELSYLFPAVVSVKEIAKCILGTEEPLIFYILLRGKAQGCNASSIPWHQDTAYHLYRATQASWSWTLLFLPHLHVSHRCYLYASHDCSQKESNVYGLTISVLLSPRFTTVVSHVVLTAADRKSSMTCRQRQTSTSSRTTLLCLGPD